MIGRCCCISSSRCLLSLPLTRLAASLRLTACLRLYSHTASSNVSLTRRFIPLRSVSPAELGPSLMYHSSTLKPVSPKSTQQFLTRGVVAAKILSLSSSVMGLVMVPILTQYLWEAAADRPAVMMFAIVANSFLILLSFTPFLLQFLVKRFIVDLRYNPETKVFTTIHYGFFLNKKALRFRADEVVDAAKAPEMKKLWLPLATVFVHQRPLLLSLNVNSYTDPVLFAELTKNVVIPPGSD
ncbi:hypothetical protein AB6A40_007750 [Gnathostoma spinigerum]|uniref:Transmembrane protein 70 n=1 Tax=Gnathostoma spinigerum TaxID=75299 RepID=A0ABD6EUB3_9BILA